MISIRCLQGVLILLFVSIVCLGCAEDPHFSHVTGVVTYDGVPVSGAIISFVPIGSMGVAAGGFTDEKGAYVLTAVTANGAQTGTLPGKYRVSIAKTELVEDGTALAYKNGEITYDEYQDRLIENGGSSSYTKSLIPERYGSAKTSQLEAEILNTKPSVFNFDLKP